ncbi:ANTH domain-containing protein [Cephalotus follicularis]|uniref:ANTH domain-containing protein n=1 Tax=Cephalotus follicularis TaxID=3775 RepID=A0A1Q3CT47_CEPFO|nr:ANTH domain-containing protein [Cephalotus follicularis]
MGNRKKLRILIGFMKDKASIIKATLSTKRNTSAIHRKILQATTHGECAPPSDHRVTTILSLGHGSHLAVRASIETLMDRLRATHDATVALKSLFIIHNILSKGSFILQQQLSIYLSCGGYNSLNLSNFRDDLDPETWELSSWVRWYANILEQTLMVTRVLEYCFSSSSSSTKKVEDKEKVLSSSDLLNETDILVQYVAQICNAPDSLHLQSHRFVYEVIRLVSEDYRLIQREIFIRVTKTGERMRSLNIVELTQFQSSLNKFEDCKQRLGLLFANRVKNDGLWDLISETKSKVLVVINEKKEEERLAKIKRNESTELTRFRERFPQSGQMFWFTSTGGGWLALDWVSLTVSTVG